MFVRCAALRRAAADGVVLNSAVPFLDHIKRLPAYSAFMEYIGRRFFFARSNGGHIPKRTLEYVKGNWPYGS